MAVAVTRLDTAPRRSPPPGSALPPLPAHGGDLDAARARWGEPALGWLDLSTGINPWPYPIPDLPATVWARLPGTAENQALRAAAAQCYGLPDGTGILALPGTGSAIRALPRLRAPGEVAVVGPTYGEHAAAWAAAGHRVRTIATLDQRDEAPVVVVVSPNNPDGGAIALDSLTPLADELAARGGLLVIDQAFADCLPQPPSVPAPRPGLIALRSFGKFHGLAGLRLGLAIAAPPLIARLADALGPWPVSGPALIIGARALADTPWATQTRLRLDRAARALDKVLTQGGLPVAGGTPLFRLVAHPDAHALWDRLGRQGILTRAFADRPGHLRLGLPATPEELDRLGQALRRS